MRACACVRACVRVCVCVCVCVCVWFSCILYAHKKYSQHSVPSHCSPLVSSLTLFLPLHFLQGCEMGVEGDGGWGESIGRGGEGVGGVLCTTSPTPTLRRFNSVFHSYAQACLQPFIDRSAPHTLYLHTYLPFLFFFSLFFFFFFCVVLSSLCYVLASLRLLYILL